MDITIRKAIEFLNSLLPTRHLPLYIPELVNCYMYKYTAERYAEEVHLLLVVDYPEASLFCLPRRNVVATVFNR